MADVTGPISSMPGSLHICPKGMICDNDHQGLNIPATIRVQCETDSMGAEMEDLCQECYDKMKIEMAVSANEPCICDWCNTETTDCRQMRDFEEGMSGRLYDVCAACRRKQSTDLQDEFDEACDVDDDCPYIDNDDD